MGELIRWFFITAVVWVPIAIGASRAERKRRRVVAISKHDVRYPRNR